MRISDWSSDVCSSDLRIVSVEPVGDSVTVTVAAPAALAPHIAPKGSITVDGVSLTVNEVTDQPDGEAFFTLNIIPHTQEMTTLNEAAAGRPVNLAIDIIARSEEHTSELQSLMRIS